MAPNWTPLEARLGAERCVGFMFMGRTNGINQYKHAISRRYLFLDDEGHAYRTTASGAFRRIRFREALRRLEAP